jgi:hypothetical protein
MRRLLKVLVLAELPLPIIFLPQLRSLVVKLLNQ